MPVSIPASHLLSLILQNMTLETSELLSHGPSERVVRECVVSFRLQIWEKISLFNLRFQSMGWTAEHR